MDINISSAIRNMYALHVLTDVNLQVLVNIRLACA